MYLVLIAWLYVTLMMAVAEATSPTGTLLGAAMTFVLYGLLPMGIVGYILSTPARKRAIKAREIAEQAAYDEEQARRRATAAGDAPGPAGPSTDSAAPDTGGQPAAGPQDGRIASVRKEPG